MSGVSSSVHFRGQEPVMQAYRDRSVEAWSLWQGKQFLTKGTDESSLQAFLDILFASGSAATYTVRVYEDIIDIKKIKSSTPDDGSFNFRLREPDAYGTPTGTSFAPQSVLEKRILELDQKFELVLERFATIEEPAEADEPAGIMGTINGLLKDPEKIERLIRIGKALMGSGEPLPSGFIGNVNRLEPAAGTSSASSSPEERLHRLGAAIDTLEQKDPNLVEHLEKLAKIAAEKPSQFLTLISMLDVF